MNDKKTDKMIVDAKKSSFQEVFLQKWNKETGLQFCQDLLFTKDIKRHIYELDNVEADKFSNLEVSVIYKILLSLWYKQHQEISKCILNNYLDFDLTKDHLGFMLKLNERFEQLKDISNPVLLRQYCIETWGFANENLIFYCSSSLSNELSIKPSLFSQLDSFFKSISSTYVIIIFWGTILIIYSLFFEGK